MKIRKETSIRQIICGAAKEGMAIGRERVRIVGEAKRQARAEARKQQKAK